MKDVVISLFDFTGTMVRPWIDAGYTAYIVDTQHPPTYDANGVTRLADRFFAVNHDLARPWLPPVIRERIAFVAAFPPCDHLAVSGARWFRGKGLRRLADSIHLFATAAEFCDWAGAPYMIENPVSTISTHWRKPDYTFDPWQYAGHCVDDNYTKRTCLWTGHGFVMPDPFPEPDLGLPDDRIHKAPPSVDRANLRSATPLGFARAVFGANHAPF